MQRPVGLQDPGHLKANPVGHKLPGRTILAKCNLPIFLSVVVNISGDLSVNISGDLSVKGLDVLFALPYHAPRNAQLQLCNYFLLKILSILKTFFVKFLSAVAA